MSAIPYEPGEEEWGREEQDTLALPRRPRRQLFNRRSATLIALIVGVIGFYAGVRVEKGQLSSSSSTGLSLPPSLATAARGGATSRGATGTGSASRSGFPGPGAFGGGGTSIGTVSSVNGKTIYISDSSGNTVKVKLSSATKLTKSLAVRKKAVRPGDSVLIQGARNSNGTLSATSISDSGASATSSGTTGGSGSTSGSSGSGVSSLFGSGSG
jgi:hypothetical protein